jgi:signal transduction histidine kinase
MAWKLFLSFTLVLITALGVLAVFISKTAEREVRGYLLRSGITDTSHLVASLSEHYQEFGSWEQVEDLLGPSGTRGGGNRGEGTRQGQAGNVTLADASGDVIYGHEGKTFSDDERAASIPIELAGETVGFLQLAPVGESPEEIEFLDRFRQGVWISAIVAGIIALVVGGILLSSLLRPIKELTRAAGALAGGDLSQRVYAQSNDEIGDLAIAFNQMAENLDHAESLRREMTADIAHELRTPLAVMQARVEAILDGVHPATHENLQPVLDQTLLLNRLVDDLRTISLAESGQLTIQPSQVELNSLVRQAADLFREEAASAGVVLIVRIEDGAPFVAMVDSDRMEQVLGNIISNAIRYSPQEGEVEISLFRNDDKDLAVIEIGDRGEGIPEEALPHLFERFYRAPSDSRTQKSSTGLGLAIARKLVEAHKGEITAANRPGGGALFTIKIPLNIA